MAMRRVVATVALVGLAPGDPVWADDTDPQVARWLRGGQLRALDGDPQPEVEDLTDAVVVVNSQLGDEGGEQRSSASLAPPEPQVEVEPAPRRPRSPKK